jgi:hypothetical protein
MEERPKAAVVDVLPALPPGSPREEEWNTFRRELPRLLAEGHQGRFALLHRDAVAGVWDTLQEAIRAGYERFGLAPFLVQEVVVSQRPLRAGGLWYSS